MAKKPRRLFRGKDQVLGGVCSGMAEYFETDITVIRVLWAVLTIITGVLPGCLAYIACWIIIPKKS